MGYAYRPYCVCDSSGPGGVAGLEAEAVAAALAPGVAEAVAAGWVDADGVARPPWLRLAADAVVEADRAGVGSLADAVADGAEAVCGSPAAGAVAAAVAAMDVCRRGARYPTAPSAMPTTAVR